MNQAKPKITIWQLKNFILVVEEKGFQAAAKKASRSQPGISKSIRKLEGAVGGTLFEKGSNSTLTSLGKYLFAHAKELVAMYDKTIKDVMLYSQTQVGHLTIAVLPSVAGTVLPGIIKAFISRYPNIQVAIQDENSETIHRRVLNGTVDFGISHQWEADHNLEMVDLLRDPVGLVCSQDHPLAQIEAVNWEMLGEHKFIGNGTVRLWKDSVVGGIAARATLSISNMISLIAVLEANIGVTTLPYLAFPKNNQQLCFRPISNPTVERTIGLISRRKFSGPPAMQAMREIVIEHFRTYTID